MILDLIIRLAVFASVIAYVVWIVRSFTRKQYRTAMVLIMIAMIVVGGVAFAIYKVFSCFDPYIIEPQSVVEVAPNTKDGYSVAGGTLSVVSSNDVVCVADPGASFQYAAVWLAPLPPAKQGQVLRLYKFDLPGNANTNHIYWLNAEAPANILEVATGDNQW